MNPKQNFIVLSSVWYVNFTKYQWMFSKLSSANQVAKTGSESGVKISQRLMFHDPGFNICSYIDQKGNYTIWPLWHIEKQVKVTHLVTHPNTFLSEGWCLV